MELSDINTLEEVDGLTWEEFEEFIAVLFSALGYETKQVGGKTDHGADVIASANGTRVAIQVKHRSKKRRDGSLVWVGETAVRAVVTAKPLYECSRGIVVTNSTYAPGTDRVAKAHDIELWDRERLRRELENAHSHVLEQSHLTCSWCGSRVSPEVRDKCLSKPDEFGDRVYCEKHQEFKCAECGGYVSPKIAEECYVLRDLLDTHLYCEEHRRLTCVLCGEHVSRKVAAWCLEHRDDYGGRVYCYEHQRSYIGVLRLAGE